MCVYYYDEDHGIAYKIDPIVTSLVWDEEDCSPGKILVHTDVKVTNIKREKVRRTLSEFYPSAQYDLDTARREFSDTHLNKLIDGAKEISEQEYLFLKEKFES